MPVHVNDSWPDPSGVVQRQLHEIDRVTDRIDGSIQADPIACHLHVRFIHPPRPVGQSPFPAEPLTQNRRIALHPAPNGDVIHRQTAFRRHLLQIAIAKRIPQIPPNAENNYDVLEVSSPEQRWSMLGH